MRHINIIVALVTIALTVTGVERSYAQDHGERRLVREGNAAFKAKNYRESLAKYEEALEVNPDCFEAQYNRANAYHHVAREDVGRDSAITWEASNKLYEDMLKDTRLSNEQRAEIYRNIGTSLVLQEEYEAALNAFRESLVLNGADEETKYNYVLTKRIVDQKRNQPQNNQDQNQNNQNNQGDQSQDNQNNQGDQNKDNQDNQGDQNRDNQNNQGDQNKDNQDNQGDQNKDDHGNDDEQDDEQQGGGDGQEEDDKRDAPQQGGNQPQGLSDEQERLLDAIQGEEDKTQEKLDEDKASAIYVPGKKNW